MDVRCKNRKLHEWAPKSIESDSIFGWISSNQNQIAAPGLSQTCSSPQGWSIHKFVFSVCFISTATRDATLCVIANPAFVVYSSIVSFYVPFIITLLVYVQIYVVLRKRRKRVNTKPKQRVCQAVDTNVATSLKVSRYWNMLLFEAMLLWLHSKSKLPLFYIQALYFYVLFDYRTQWRLVHMGRRGKALPKNNNMPPQSSSS